VTNPEALLQLARLVGRDTFYDVLDMRPGAEPVALDERQREQLRLLIDDRFEGVAAALIAEAMASDDVHDQASAVAYISDRLDFLADLITPMQREALMAACEAGVSEWGPSS
jgi:hypothetical protein